MPEKHLMLDLRIVLADDLLKIKKEYKKLKKQGIQYTFFKANYNRGHKIMI